MSFGLLRRLYNRDGTVQAAGDYKEAYDVIPARQVLLKIE